MPDENLQPREWLDPILVNVGRIIYNWNRSEISAQRLLAVIAGDTTRIHVLITHMGNRGLQDSLTTLANEYLEEEQREVVTNIVNRFADYLGERNFVVHAFSGWQAEANRELMDWEIEAARLGSGNIRERPSGDFYAYGAYLSSLRARGKLTLQECVINADQAAEIGQRFHRFYCHILEVTEHFRDAQTPLPQKFSEPVSLNRTQSSGREHLRRVGSSDD